MGERTNNSVAEEQRFSSPTERSLPLLTHLPVSAATVTNLYDLSPALQLALKWFVTKKAANIASCFVNVHIKMHQTITSMEERWMIKPMVTGEKRWVLERMQERNNFLAIFHPQSPHLSANAPEMACARHATVPVPEQ